jgi:hypothetical protein
MDTIKQALTVSFFRIRFHARAVCGQICCAEYLLQQRTQASRKGVINILLTGRSDVVQPSCSFFSA